MRSRTLNQRPPQFTLNAGHPLANGLVFAGLGNKAGSTLYRDSSRYGNHATTSAMEVSDWVFDPTLRQWVLDYDGASEYAQTSGNVLHNVGSGPFTWSCWVRKNALSAGAGILANGAYAPTLAISATTGVYYLYWDSSLTFSLAHTAGTWQHVALVRRGDTCFFYADGTLDGTTRSVAGKSMANAAFTIASDRAAGGGYPFDGKIGSVLFHARDLSSGELAELADPSNAMLSGLILPPRRRLFRGPSMAGSASASASASGSLSASASPSASPSASISQSASPSASGSSSASASASRSASASPSLSASATGSTSPSPSVSESTSESSSFSESLSASSSESSSESSEDTTMVLTVEIVRSDIFERIGEEATLTVGGNQQRRRMKATTSETEVAIQSGFLAGLCYVWHDDTDTTATYLDIGYSTGDYTHRLLPGECGVIPLSGTAASLFIVSDDDTYFEYEISERTIDIVGT